MSWELVFSVLWVLFLIAVGVPMIVLAGAGLIEAWREAWRMIRGRA